MQFGWKSLRLPEEGLYFFPSFKLVKPASFMPLAIELYQYFLTCLFIVFIFFFFPLGNKLLQASGHPEKELKIRKTKCFLRTFSV